MLIKRAVLDRIADGEIDLVFRRWKRPTVRTGGQLRTAVGVLEILRVEEVARSAVSVADARRAGYRTRAELLAELDTRTDGTIHRIEVRPGGADPRIDLRNRATFGAGELEELQARLGRLDARSPAGPWTERYLGLIAANPHVRAQDLADRLGVDKPAFKGAVTKLKALGLTVSHSPGYEVSPRGRALLAALDARR